MARMRWFVVLALAALGMATQAPAQELAGCTAEALTDPARTLYRCAGGLVIEAEAGAGIALSPAPDGGAETAEVDGKAVFVDIPAGRGAFQILTPHAIASVRGTVWAVDVGADKTAVFVSEGSVAVSRRDGSDAVDLGPGEGVDVAPGDAPLSVRRWPEQRVRGLLARFGR